MDDNTYYLKSEADKVIAEKDKEITNLKTKLDYYERWLSEWRKLAEKFKPNKEYNNGLG